MNVLKPIGFRRQCMSDPIYTFDQTGTNPNNKITDELQTVTPVAHKDFYFLIPKKAPFYRLGLVIHYVDENRDLIEGIHWIATHKFIQASRSLARPVYGSITLLDKNISGILKLTYQTLGGDWLIDNTTRLGILAQVTTNPRITTWEQVSNAPLHFPSIDHQWNLDDLVGLSEVKTTLEGIAQVITDKAPGNALLASHVENTNNPHGTNKAQLGLALVQNYPVATDNQARLGELDNVYMTAKKVKVCVDYTFPLLLQSHVQLRNPHNTTKADIALGNVPNYLMASTDQSVNGTLGTLFISPKGVSEHVSSRLSVYYTKAEVDALLAALEARLS